MRFLAILAVSAAVLTPALASADPDQAQAQPAMQAQAPAAPAQQTAQAAPAGANSGGANLNEIECRSQPPTTGTRLGATRECHTVREWNQRQQDSQQKLQETQMHGLTGFAGPAGGTK
jgi:hypothetical protein